MSVSRGSRARACLALSLLALSALCPARAAEPVYHAGTTRKIRQLTGDVDTPLRRATLSLTETRSGITGTDLGSSFEHKGQICFLFGDTHGRPGFRDTLGFSSTTNPTSLTISVPVEEDGKFLRIAIPGIELGIFAVPSAGISLGGSIYIVYTTDWHDPTKNMERSVLARSDDDGRTWAYLYDMSAAVDHDMTNARFINAGMATVDADDYGGELPCSSGTAILIWGSGAYRKSNPRLACVAASQIENKAALRYFAGFGPDDAPTWSAEEAASIDLFDSPYLGEFSIAWIPQVARWVLLYNSGSPRGITMRTALKPWGPYSPPRVILGPFKDGAYGHFMHVPWVVAHLDGFHDPSRENDWGGEYGPYIIPRFTEGDARRCRIYYLLSTWNPYQIILARSEIGEPLPDPPVESASVYLTPGDPAWRLSSSDFFANFFRGEKPYITTFTSEGDAARGWMWRWLPRDSRNARLEFDLHGGEAEVVLIEGGPDIPTTSGLGVVALYDRIKRGDFGDVVQCTWGHRSNDIDVAIDWNLRPFDSENLKILVIDKLAEPWGFVSVSRMTLHRFPPPQSSAATWQAY